MASVTEVVFNSEELYQDCIKPYKREEVSQFLASQHDIQVTIDPSLTLQKHVALKTTPSNPFYTELFNDGDLLVYYSERPRAPHQLNITFGERVKHLKDLSSEDAQKLHEMICKINEVYVGKLGINGFVVAQYSNPQIRHEGQYTVELHPHQPGYGDTRNFLDKADSNRAVLFDDGNYTNLEINYSDEQRDRDIAFWKKELLTEQPSLSDQHSVTVLPARDRLDCGFKSGKEFAVNHLLEYFENNGAKIINKPDVHFKLSAGSQLEQKTWETASCAFCRSDIIERQKAFELDGVVVLYNFRKMPEAATSFLILPKGHTEKIYALNPSEVETIHLLKRALTNVLEERFPGYEIVIYNQDALSVGQTVPHAHDQIVAIDKERIPMHWSMLSLAYNPGKLGGVSKEEMAAVTKEFSILLEQEVQRLRGLTEVQCVAI
ncbi:MAG: hypothetical protein S4CHLAM6_15110 [Chlamydiae bacterium]|nr:hypothetical protein [Chlamydiota bacterium]